MLERISVDHILTDAWENKQSLSGTGDSQRDSRESFAIETPIFRAVQADSPESLEFSIRANHPIRAISTISCESIRASHATKNKIIEQLLLHTP